jgi:hypothetical protein
MNAHLKGLLIAALAISFGRALPAQVSSFTDDGDAHMLIPARGPVLSEPHSAETRTTQTQTLADGTHIKRSMSWTRVYRDSQGRTRTERYLSPLDRLDPKAKDQLLSVEISDPAAGAHYILNIRNHTATEFLLPVPSPAQAEWDARASQPVVQRPHRSPLHAIYSSLGTDQMEGLLVEGQRETMTIATEAQGNDAPIVVVTDRWLSPDLQIWVLVKRTDPRSGESVTQTANIERAEPDPSLFEVPSDYTVTRQPAVHATLSDSDVGTVGPIQPSR